MIRALPTLVVLGLASTAWADAKVGVVVGGADGIRAQSEREVGTWLTDHSMSVAPAPLNKDGVATLLNCLVISDMTCARSVVEARATASSVVGIVEQVSGKREKRSVQLSAYWIAKRHDVISLQRTCDHCTDAVLAKTLDGMMADLARLAPAITGRVHVTSDPPGVTTMIDHQPVGVTPVDHDVSFGAHTITLMRDGRAVGEREVEVAPDATVEVAVPIHVDAPVAPAPAPPPVEPRRSRAVPAVTIGVGVVAIITGSVLYAVGGPTGKSFMYRDLRPAGVGVAAGGAVTAILGTIWFVRRGSTSSAPDVAITSGGATIGWTGSF